MYLILISARMTFVHQLKSSQNKNSVSKGKARKISLSPAIPDPPPNTFDPNNRSFFVMSFSS